MDSKFLGVGLTNVLLIWLAVTLLSLMAKVIFTKYPIDGVSQIFQAS
jgi:hypothetical protein